MGRRLYLLAVLLIYIDIMPFTVAISVDDPHWVPFNPDADALPAAAIAGGYENETLYITRAPHEGSLTPGKYVPSIQKAIIPWGTLTFVKNVTEILCGHNYQWTPTNAQNISSEIVVGGRSEIHNETIYICRVRHENHFIVGKVHQKICYIPFKKQEITKFIFEILTVPQKISVTESTTVSEPHWVPFNPATDALPADAIVGGNDNVTLYIGRTLYKGYRVPGKYDDSTLLFTLPYFDKSYRRNISEILCGHNYKWVIPSRHDIPAGAVVGGKSDTDNETLYIGRTYFRDQIIPGKIKPSTEVIYIPYEDTEAWSSYFEVLVVQIPPVITQNSSVYNVIEGRNLSLRIPCEATGTPKPIVTWKVNGRIVLNDSPHNKFSVKNGALVFNEPKVTSNEPYIITCEADNDAGSDNVTFQVNISHEPHLTSNTTEMLVANHTFNVVLNSDIPFESESLVKETQNVSYSASNVGFGVQTLQCLIAIKPNTDHIMPLMSIPSPASNWPTLDSTGDFLQVEAGQTVIFSCDNSGGETNHFEKFPERAVVTASCIGQDRFMVEDKSYKISELLCTEVQIVVTKKSDKCLTETSKLLRVGYEVQGLSETYEVCFETTKEVPLYSHVMMTKSNIPGGVYELHKWHKYRTSHARRDTYTCNNATSTCCYTKTQLVNARDVSVGRTTFIDPLNAVPHWRPCGMTQSPWEKIEDTVRSLIDTYDQIDVWSGTHMLQEGNGTVTPRYLWKVLRFDDTKSLAIVYVNGPSPSEADILCKNTCGDDEAVPWSYDYNEHTYCCNVDEFLHAFGLGGSAVGKPTQRSLDKILRKKFSTSNPLLRKLTERTSNIHMSQDMYFAN